VHAYENRVFLGAFLCISGVFLPWFSFRYLEHVVRIIGDHLADGVCGYMTIFGLAVLVSSLVVVAFIVGAGSRMGPRLWAGVVFFASLTVFLFFVGGVAPLFRIPGAEPRIGLLFMLAGGVLMFLGLRGKSLSD